MAPTYGKLSVVVGGQYGSEAKGHVAGWLAKPSNNERREVYGIRTGGPNAGHTAYDPAGRKWALRQIPVIAVTNYDAKLVIAAGSEIDPEVLSKEIWELERAGIAIKHRLFVDGSATIIEPRHLAEEATQYTVSDRGDGPNGGVLKTEGSLVERTGSTGKGIGAARADRIMRRALRVDDLANTEWFDSLMIAPTDALVRAAVNNGRHAIIEGTQGYGLGLHGRHYPQCTSADVRAIDLLSAVGVSPWDLRIPMGMPSVWVVLRVYPIRVAGNSGPLMGETSWQELGLPEEHTTVTKKVRRVGDWDAELAYEAVRANGGKNANIALTMVDQKLPEVRDMLAWRNLGVEDQRQIRLMVNQVESDIGGAKVQLIGTGPNSMMEMNHL